MIHEVELKVRGRSSRCRGVVVWSRGSRGLIDGQPLSSW